MQAVLKCRVLSNNVCEYEVNQLTNEKVIRGKRYFNAGRPPTGRIHQSISQTFMFHFISIYISSFFFI